MKDLEILLVKPILAAVKELFGADLPENQVNFQTTRKEFEGDITLVVFPMVRFAKKSPEQTAEVVGNYLVENIEFVEKFNVVKGFLNMVISESYWLDTYAKAFQADDFGRVEATEKDPQIVVEYSSPNTNKPLHLGHVRNNLLGYSVAEIIKASGKRVKKVQIINDRGIHICKSMLAWKLFGEGETPESTGIKGDHLVGKYYVRFDQEYKKEIAALLSEGKTEDEAKKEAPLLVEAQNMLRLWEAKDEEVIALWEMMNQWVYDGFDSTYTRMGVDFDKHYYESDTYLLGKKYIDSGLEKGIFYKKEDGSVWVDLTNEKLDHKLLLRGDGTSVYMTQDIGTAIQRYLDFDFNKMVYTVGNEQDYHFNVLFKILNRLGYSWAKDCHHLSYGMVDLPSGKMKSREGTVVDADDLMQEMVSTAKTISEDLGKLEGFTEDELASIYELIGMGALKYFILKVDPKKRMLFDPTESIDFNGHTGPFIQYTHARICSLKRRAEDLKMATSPESALHPKEKELLKVLLRYPEVIQEAAADYSPAVIANYTYDLVKEYNQFYQQVPIFGVDSEQDKAFRIGLSGLVGNTIASAMKLLGITVPERM
ncbi:MAG: arginine--tRNA ligase [Flavobacteriales bacterium]|tara:strand:- start:1739 stop:3523 length:1785 start_codon:yes stop_codon:yes gene_type:complete